MRQRRLPSLAASLLLALLASGAWAEEDADKLAARAILAFDKTAASYLQTRHSEGRTMRMQVFVDPRRGVRVEFKEPSSVAGMIGVDDFRRFRLYDPEARSLTILPSQFRQAASAPLRARLVQQNYRARIRGQAHAAGRPTKVIGLTSVHGHGHAWTMAVDSEKGVLLQLTSQSPEGGVVRHLETHLAYFERLPKFNSDLGAPAGLKVREEPAPPSWKDAAQAARTIGFEPRIPARLPFGFQVVRREILGEKPRQFAAVAMTDGLFSATVVLWDGSVMGRSRPSDRDGRPIPVLEADSLGVFGGVTGDAPGPVKRSLVKACMADRPLQAAGPGNCGTMEEGFHLVFPSAPAGGPIYGAHQS
jgi:hypothetical protein